MDGMGEKRFPFQQTCQTSEEETHQLAAPPVKVKMFEGKGFQITQPSHQSCKVKQSLEVAAVIVTVGVSHTERMRVDLLGLQVTGELPLISKCRLPYFQ
ncbi:hypothetical protein FGO68_gene7121 [Halteria grandinella]|uniref:Uncharacterized protein n=1 Tax=Halteria grandinella TaxID=5974 RepID=A0A8J8SWN0_HALGN|nr:hypothetical protein FGO68_gene7121 [Halteria grandinella]